MVWNYQKANCSFKKINSLCHLSFSASKITTFWRYTNLFIIIIIIIFFTPGSKDPRG